MKPTIQGVLETALYVDDLVRSQAFYEGHFGFKGLLADERMCALEVSEAPRQVLLLFRKGGSTKGEETPGGFIPPHDGTGKLHMAFRIDAADLEAWRKYFEQHGIAIESEVRANNGYSIYFRDPDGHLIELATAGLWDISKDEG